VKRYLGKHNGSVVIIVSEYYLLYCRRENYVYRLHSDFFSRIANLSYLTVFVQNPKNTIIPSNKAKQR
jgi:hypothetical protein